MGGDTSGVPAAHAGAWGLTPPDVSPAHAGAWGATPSRCPSPTPGPAREAPLAAYFSKRGTPARSSISWSSASASSRMSKAWIVGRYSDSGRLYASAR